MKVYKSMDFWAVYKLPIPYRKWLITRWNKDVDSESKSKPQDDTSKPLPPAMKEKLKAQTENYRNVPRKSIERMMRPIKNY